MALHTTPTIDKYTVKEVLNQVINTDADALKVDIDNVTLKTEGSDINIEVHTDKAEDSMMIWTHTVKTGTGGTSYVPLVDGDGHLQVDVLTTPADDSLYAEDSQHTSTDKGNFVLGVRNDTLAALGGTDGDYSPLQVNASGALFVDVADGGQLDTIIDTLETTLTAIETDQAAIEVLLTAANVDHAANEVLLGTIDADTDAIKTDMAAIEVLLTSANVDHAANEVLLGTIDADTNAIKVDMAAIEVLLTAANVDHAANEVLLGTIDSDTNDIKPATESSASHLGNMFYDTALAVTPSDGSDLSGEPFYAVYVGTGGDLKVDMADGGSAVTLSNVASGQLLPIMVERIYSTGTTASNIIAFK